MDALAVFIDSLVIGSWLLDLNRSYARLNRPGRKMAVSDDQMVSVGISHLLMVGNVFSHFIFNGHTQHLLSPLSQDFRQNVPAFG
jgi:hypothetical protein